MALFEQIEIPYRRDSGDYLERLRSLGGSVWLDSGKPGSVSGRWDILSAAPLFTISLQPQLCCDGAAPGTVANAPTLQDAIANTLRWLDGKTAPKVDPNPNPKPSPESDPEPNDDMGEQAGELPFRAGLIGYWSYDLGLSLHGITTHLPDTVHLPQAELGCYTWALLQDHETHRALLTFHRHTPAKLRQRVITCINDLSAATPADESFRLVAAFQPSISEVDYLAAIARIRDYIHAGDCYQVNFTQHWSAPFAGDPWRAYRTLREPLASPFSAWLDNGRQQILCFSPERFIEVQDRYVETRPIKGTLRRGETPEEDARNAATLASSAKDRAENLMIVDLLRNDLGHCCEPGSIRADRLFELESYPNVHHLVSTVTGTLRQGVSAAEMLLTAFPGGSITGAPKRRAMEIIEETESAHRGLYCGCIGYLDVSGHMDTNIVIRTLVAETRRLHCWAGGGIVADSEPLQEYRESLDKVGMLMRVLERSLAQTAWRST